MTAPSQTSEIAAPAATAAQFVPALRNAAAAGLVAFVLCFPIISYHAESNINNELVLNSRWPLSFAITAHRLCLCVFAADGARRLADLVRPHRFGRRRRHGRRVGAGCAGRRGDRPAIGSPGGVRALYRSVHAWPRDPVPVDRPWPSRAWRLIEMDQQLRHPDHDLRDAGLGIEHRGRPRRPSRSGLRGVLCGWRLFVCAAFDHLRPFVLDLPAACRNPRRDVGRHPRLPGPEAPRRLSRHRDARLRRDHPNGADQLGRLDQRLRRHQ